jgi:putative tryptophan/tyrosine transport system substrate-binding protein
MPTSEPTRMTQLTQLTHERAYSPVACQRKGDSLKSANQRQGKPMRRREFVPLLGGAIVIWAFGAMAQEPGRTYRLGGLSSSPGNAPHFVAMFDELRRLGFIEGQNLTTDWRSYGPRIDLMPEFAAELVKASLDVILVNGSAAIRAAQQATKTIPILGITEDMVGSGLVNSMARPAHNRW